MPKLSKDAVKHNSINIGLKIYVQTLLDNGLSIEDMFNSVIPRSPKNRAEFIKLFNAKLSCRIKIL